MNPDIDQLAQTLMAYLREQLHEPMLAYESALVQLQGGFETYVYRFQLNSAQRDFSQPLILRLYPERYGSGNAIWESSVQNVLAAAGYPVARAHLLCTDMSILGGAFFIMDFLPGQPMITAPIETLPELLGKTHAALHSIDPTPLISTLAEQGIAEEACRLDRRIADLQEKGRKFPWMHDAIGWLVEHRPPEPEQLAICHGDFHPLNILVQDGKVSGVLDWPGFLIADPALDVAITLTLITIPIQYIGPALGLDLATADLRTFEQRYRAAYSANRARSEVAGAPLDKSHLTYYRVRRCVHACIEGAEGQAVWQHPAIVNDLRDYIYWVTGVQVTVPT